MTFSRSALLVSTGVVAGLIVGGTAVAFAAPLSTTVSVCVTSKDVVRSASAKGACPKKTTKVAINKIGPAGATGATGATGAKGSTGATGAKGSNAAVTIHTSLLGDETDNSYALETPAGTIYFQCADDDAEHLIFSSEPEEGMNLDGTVTKDDEPYASAWHYRETGDTSAAAADWMVLDMIVTNENTRKSASVQVGYERDNSTQTCELNGQMTPVASVD